MDYPHFQISRFGVAANVQRMVDFVHTHHPPPTSNTTKTKFFRQLERVVQNACVPDHRALLQAMQYAHFAACQRITNSTEEQVYESETCHHNRRSQSPRKRSAEAEDILAGGSSRSPLIPVQTSPVKQLTRGKDDISLHKDMSTSPIRTKKEHTKSVHKIARARSYAAAITGQSSLLHAI